MTVPVPVPLADPVLKELFFNPPIAIARLGSSPVPVESFTWGEDPSRYGAGHTAIAPAISFEIGPDDVPRPYMPSVIHFKDELGIRPTAPFFELWANVDRGGALTEEPVTLALLDELKLELGHVSYELRLANRKAARRSGDEACAFLAYAQRNATEFGRVALDAISVTPGQNPLVFSDRPIPLGALHVLRPVTAHEMSVDLSVLRVRIIPAKGLVYGPPAATAAFDPDTMRLHELVPAENRILNPAAAWCSYDGDYAKYENPEPSDTYDGADAPPGSNPFGSPNWGVVDDTCDGVLTARVHFKGVVKVASARVAVAPPDYAPDRRCFLSLADDLSDRDAPPIDDPTADEIVDLFQRVFETVSLLHLDYTRDRAIGENEQNPLTAPAKPPRKDRGTMTYLDVGYALESPKIVFDTIPTKIDPANIPPTPQAGRYAKAAVDTHSQLGSAEYLLDWLRANADRVRSLVRPPWAPFAELAPNRVGVKKPPAKGRVKRLPPRDPRSDDDAAHDMRMPPYMRDESASSLSLTRRQYGMVMAFLDKVVPAAQARAGVFKAQGIALAQLTPGERHMHDVLQRIRTPQPAAAAKPATPATPAKPAKRRAKRPAIPAKRPR